MKEVDDVSIYVPALLTALLMQEAETFRFFVFLLFFLSLC